jgi:tetratricopeptide (TPR) repeat protein
MAPTEPASVGVALIARDAANTLGACLDSIRPFVEQIVVAVDELTTDRTAEVAWKCGADVVTPVKVSDWHECPDHGRVLAQHFARARNVSFGYLDPDLDWWMWIDADDVLEGGEHLKAALAGVPDEACGVWLSYVYSSLNNYKSVNTVFDRERLLRTRWRGQPLRWEWEYRVHEVVKPVGVEPVWARENRVRVLHQEGVHKSGNSAKRNLLLLEIDLEEKGEDARTVFYVANQYFAMGEMAPAAEWYERLTQIRGANPYEVWQSFCYLSLAYERLGDLDNATRAAYCAIDVTPDHPEPYFRLATIYCLAGEYRKTLTWDRLARTKKPPPNFVFTNPLDYSYNSRTALADAYARLGHVSEARELLEQADAVVPSEKLRATIAHYTRMEADARVAQAFVELAAVLPTDRMLALYSWLPEGVKAFGRTRDAAVPAMLEKRNKRCAA